ncbi:RNA-directed DNA polymerase, eukaryota, reverse transcriptase zinc-binding domain protein [Tanacetum coccineum]
MESLRASFFWGASVDKKKLAWIKWSNVLASIDKGGLGVGCLKAFNQALLIKWRWRLIKSPSTQCVKVLKSIHGDVLFAPITQYASTGEGPICASHEFKEMVKSLHLAGIETKKECPCETCRAGTFMASHLDRCHCDESRCYHYTLDVQQRSRDAIVVHEMFNGGVEMLSRVEMLSLYMRCSTDESRCYRCTLDVQRRSRDDIVIH